MPDTKFTKKSCVKCKSNFEGDGVLCGFCREKIDRHNAKNHHSIPSDFWVECLIEREGSTTTSIGGVNYLFTRNDQNRAVCEVVNHYHYNRLISGANYRPYIPDPEEFELVDMSVVLGDDERIQLIKAAISQIPIEKYAPARFGRPCIPRRSDIYDITGFTVTVKELIEAMGLNHEIILDPDDHVG